MPHDPPRDGTPPRDGEAPLRAALLAPTPAGTLDSLRLSLAMQIAPWRWRMPLEQLAGRAQHGQPLDEAVRQVRLPAELRELLLVGMTLREPTEFLLDALRARNELHRNWREFTSVIAYPLVLLVLSVLGGVVFSYIVQSLIDREVLEISEAFGLTSAAGTLESVYSQHHALMGAALVLIWSAIMLGLLRVVGPPWGWTAVIGSVVFIGRPLRWLGLQEILLRFQSMAKQGVSEGELPTAVARSFVRSGQGLVMAHVARRVQAGMPIGQALATTMLSDPLCQPALVLLDHSSGRLGEACGKCADLLGRLVQQRCRLLVTLMPLLVLVIVGSVLWAVLSIYIAVFEHLFSMLRMLQ